MGRPATPSVVSAFAAIYLFCGTTFLAIRWAVADLPPLMTIAMRCLAGGALLVVWLGMRGQWSPSSIRVWVTSALAGTLLFLGCHSVMASIEQRVSSGETALLMTAIPLWMVLLDSIRRRTPPPTLVVVGLLVGAGGVALLTGATALSGGRAGDRVALVGCALFLGGGSPVAPRAGGAPGWRRAGHRHAAPPGWGGGARGQRALLGACAVGDRPAHSPRRVVPGLPGGLWNGPRHGLVPLAPPGHESRLGGDVCI